jgi:hypothetical protein
MAGIFTVGVEENSNIKISYLLSKIQTWYLLNTNQEEVNSKRLFSTRTACST